jgi:hypothetical protein
VTVGPNEAVALARAVHAAEDARAGMLDVAARGAGCPPDYAVEQAEKMLAVQQRMVDLVASLLGDRPGDFGAQLERTVGRVLAGARVTGTVLNQGAPIPGFEVRGILEVAGDGVPDWYELLWDLVNEVGLYIDALDRGGAAEADAMRASAEKAARALNRQLDPVSA